MTPMEYVRIAAIVFVVLLFPAGYLKGCADEKERYDAFKALTEAAGKAQETATKATIARQKAITKESDDAWKSRVDRLNNLTARQSSELHDDASRSVVPPVPAAPAGSRGGTAASGVECFAGERLRDGTDASLQRFAERFARGVHGGASAIAGFQGCAIWALEQQAKAGGKLTP